MDRPIYSFSRISFECGHAFYRKYVLGESGIQNAWSEGGTFCHSLVEDVANGKCSEQEALKRFRENWHSAVSVCFPKFESGYDLTEHYYAKIFRFFDRRKYWSGKVVAVEKHVVGELPSGHMFQGYIDMALDSGRGIDLVDQKISKRFSQDQLSKKQRQLYLYAYLWRLETGEYPKRLIFNFFRDPERPIIIPFSKYYMQEALDWAKERIEHIENMQPMDYMPDAEKLMENGKRGMFCKSLCEFREGCPYVEGEYFKTVQL